MKTIQVQAIFYLLLVLVSVSFADPIDLPSDFPDLIVHQYGETAPGVLIGYFGSYNSDVSV